MPITSIRVVTVYVLDQQRALEFYRDVLGFEVRADNDMGAMGRWIEVAPPGSGDTVIMLGHAASFEREERVGEFAPCTLECDDAASTRAELAQRGATVTDIEVAHWGTHFFVRDQDANNFLVREPGGD